MAKMATREERKQAKSFKGWFKPLKWVLVIASASAAVVAFVFAGIWVFSINTDNVFPINRLEVFEQQFTSAGEVTIAMKSIKDRGFFTMDMKTAEEKFVSLPWIKSVQLRKVWPDTLQVTVEEYEPLAYWGMNGVVSTEGKVFYPEKLPEMNWVKLQGPDEMAKDLTVLLQTYQEQLLRKSLFIEGMQLSERGAISLTLNDGLKVQLGKVHVEERLERLLNHIDVLKTHKSDALAYVDLRYQNGFAAKWVSNTTPLENGGGNR